MVSQTLIQESNAHLPDMPLTAVFVGGTSGIGLYTLYAFASHTVSPTIHIVGRSQPAATAIFSKLSTINPSGTYTFHNGDVSLLAEVDRISSLILQSTPHINLLFLSQGTMTMGAISSEDLHVPASLILHSRMRFILNFLLSLRTATGLKRVVTVFAGSKAGPVTAPEDLQMRALRNPMKARGQAVCALTMLLEEARRRAPDVAFVHSYPGFVKTGITRGGGVVRNTVLGALQAVVGPFLYVPEEECGERHLFLATSGRFKAGEAATEGKGSEVVEVALGADGVLGSGIYCTDEVCESVGANGVEALRKAREIDGGQWPWKEVREDFVRITGKESL